MEVIRVKHFHFHVSAQSIPEIREWGRTLYTRHLPSSFVVYFGPGQNPSSMSLSEKEVILTVGAERRVMGVLN
jgi:hypothetical protein